MTTRLQLPGISGQTLAQLVADQQHDYCLTHPLNTPATPYRAERYAQVLPVLDPDTETETGEYETVADRVPPVPTQGEPIVEGRVYQGDGRLFIGAQNATMTHHEPTEVPALLTVWRPEGTDVLTWVEGERVAQGLYRECPLDGNVYMQRQPGEVLTVTGQEPSSGGMSAVWGLVPQDSGDSTEWAPGQTVSPGDERTYDGRLYECIQGHTTQAGWEPPNTPALWEDLGEV